MYHIICTLFCSLLFCTIFNLCWNGRAHWRILPFGKAHSSILLSRLRSESNLCKCPFSKIPSACFKRTVWILLIHATSLRTCYVMISLWYFLLYFTWLWIIRDEEVGGSFESLIVSSWVFAYLEISDGWLSTLSSYLCGLWRSIINENTIPVWVFSFVWELFEISSIFHWYIM